MPMTFLWKVFKLLNYVSTTALSEIIIFSKGTIGEVNLFQKISKYVLIIDNILEKNKKTIGANENMDLSKKMDITIIWVTVSISYDLPFCFDL